MSSSDSPPNKVDLIGQNAIVTGGAQGIGLAIATRLAQSHANVCIWDLNQKILNNVVAQLVDQSSDGKTVHGLIVDVVNAQAVDAAVTKTIKLLGSVDILVNNAGISGPNLPSWKYPLEDWLNVINVNLTGTFLVSRAVIPDMIKRDYGRIVNIASVAGKEGNPNAAAYSSSKAGVIGLTKTLGKELANTGITVNCVTPAAVRTAIFDQMTEEHIDFMLSKIPMGRFGEPEEIAALVTWLCSSECSFSTGATFDLSGGRATY